MILPGVQNSQHPDDESQDALAVELGVGIVAAVLAGGGLVVAGVDDLAEGGVAGLVCQHQQYQTHQIHL